MRRFRAIPVLLLVVVIVFLGCDNATTDPPRKLTYPEAKQLVEEMSAKWNGLIKKEGKNDEEIKLYNSITGMGVGEKNRVYVMIIEYDQETISLFKKYFLEGLDNADVVMFEEGAPATTE